MCSNSHVYSELTFTLSIMFLTGLRTLGPEVNHYGWLPMGMFPITKISCNWDSGSYHRVLCVCVCALFILLSVFFRIKL